MQGALVFVVRITEAGDDADLLAHGLAMVEPAPMFPQQKDRQMAVFSQHP
jgi:hypothetical protein